MWMVSVCQICPVLARQLRSASSSKTTQNTLLLGTQLRHAALPYFAFLEKSLPVAQLGCCLLCSSMSSETMLLPRACHSGALGSAHGRTAACTPQQAADNLHVRQQQSKSSRLPLQGGDLYNALRKPPRDHAVGPPGAQGGHGRSAGHQLPAHAGGHAQGRAHILSACLLLLQTAHLSQEHPCSGCGPVLWVGWPRI